MAARGPTAGAVIGPSGLLPGGRRTDAAAAADTPVSILLVDDNAGKRLALKAVLAPLGHRVVEADSGVAALRCVMAEDFAVILLDVRMPVMDGFETANMIRKRWQSEVTPIIFITAYASTEVTAADRAAAGAVDFIFAPIPPAELRAKVTVFANLFIRAQILAARARDVQIYADQLRLLTDAAPIGIFQADEHNRYVYTNPRWSEITGVSADEAAGRRWDTILGSEQRAGLLAELANTADDGTGLSHRFEMQRPHSDARIVLVTSKCVPDRDGGVAGWVGTLADITAEAGAEAAMYDARDAALAATLMQKNFAASASHELRTPTTSIIGFVEAVLDNKGLSDQDRRFLEIARNSAKRLNQLIDDLLILGEAEIGESVMHPEATDLVSLIDRVMLTFSATAQQADIAMVVDHEPGPPEALVDPLRVEQAVSNLISNALKFTPSGGKVTVAIRSRGETIDINVADTGLGIEPADLEKVFSRFFRAKGAVDSAAKGTGLGLAIAKKMIEAQNGRLLVTSDVGHGSTFTIALPVATGNRTPASPYPRG